VKRKGAETLVRAAADLPRGTAVLVVGSGPEDATLRRVAEDLELTERVRFCGRVPDGELPAFYAAADVFCMPCSDRYGGADTEGLGIVYLEAAASGLPAVAGRCGGSVEAVLDGITGVVLDDPSPEGLAKALRALAKDGALRARLGAAGRERAEATFAPSVQASNLEKAVSSLSV
jgi:phosphatidylinositol alpha-1,6-mannosyltransferase